MKKIIFTLSVVVLGVFTSPVPALAATPFCAASPQNFSQVVCLFVDLLNTAIPIVAGLALVVFFYGLAKFIHSLQSGNDTGVSEGKEVMKWGIVALFVMISVWGIVFFLTNDVFGLSSPGVPILPI